MGNIFKSKVQLGRESVNGTAVAATQVWRGPAGFLDEQQTLVFADEHIGNIPGKDRTYIPQVLTAIAFPDAPATYQQLISLFSAGIENATPGADGGGTNFIYDHTVPVDTQPADTFIQPYTIETGDNQGAEEAAYCIPAEISLKGVMGESLMVSSTWFGRQAAPTTFTPALSLLAVEEILMQKGKLYIDAAGGTIGSTQITNSISEIELSVKTGWQPRFTADGELFFTKAVMTRPEITLRIAFEHETQSIAEKVLMRAQTARAIRLTFEGSTFATPGTIYSVHTLNIDLAGKWETFETISDADGVSESAGIFMVKDNDAEDLYAQLIVSNEIAAYP